jgi:signal transduction histidine kinase
MPEKGDKEKILIAEVSHSVRALLESALEAEGYEVLCAQTGERAMELAESGCPDLILLNIKMLDINNGVTPLEIFKKNKAAQAIPIIYMTALDGTFDSAGVFERGAVDYITQPIDTQELSAKVRSHLAIKRLRDELEDADRQLKKQIAGSKQTQTALARAHDQLEAKMVHRMKASLLAKEAAEAASRAKDAFLANMSHEIRTSINCIIGSAHLIMTSDLSAKQREQMNHIKLSCDHLLSVTDGILDLLKIEAGRLQMARNPFHLRTLAETVIAALTPKSQEKKLALSCHIEPNVPTRFIGDPTRLRQVLFNLIYNAIKFTDSGTVSLHCRVKKNTPGKTTLHFSVTDTGIGISEEQFDRIFQRFARVDMQTQAGSNGTGLGLPISKHLVELMGGDIWVQSAPGSGSSLNFTVKLPVHHETRHAGQDPDPSGAMPITDSGIPDIQLSQRKRPEPCTSKPMSIRTRAVGAKGAAGGR